MIYPLTPDEIRRWQDRLGLSDAGAADVLHLSDRNKIMRAYTSNPPSKSPAPPTVALMKLVETVARAVVILRRGRATEAEVMLREALTPELRVRVVDHGLPELDR